MSSVRKCSKCGIADGHNRRTCPLNRAPSPASLAAPRWLLDNETTAAAVPVEEVDLCPICRDPIGKTNCATTACGHKFCLECFLKHSQIKDKCPMCRGDIAGASGVDWKAQYDDLMGYSEHCEAELSQNRTRLRNYGRLYLRRGEEIEKLRREIADLLRQLEIILE